MAFCSAFLRRYFRWFPSKCCSRYCLSYLLSPETKPVRLLLMQCSIFSTKRKRETAAAVSRERIQKTKISDLLP